MYKSYVVTLTEAERAQGHLSGGWKTCWRSPCIPNDPRAPQVCMEEVRTQVLRDIRAPLALKPGRPEREDHAYVRYGAVNRSLLYCFVLFCVVLYCYCLFCEPLAGTRWVAVTDPPTPGSTGRSTGGSWSMCAIPRPSGWCWSAIT